MIYKFAADVLTETERDGKSRVTSRVRITHKGEGLKVLLDLARSHTTYLNGFRRVMDQYGEDRNIYTGEAIFTYETVDVERF